MYVYIFYYGVCADFFIRVMLHIARLLTVKFL